MENKRSIDFELLKRVLKEAVPYRRLLVLALVMAIVIALLATLRPYLVKVMIDDYEIQILNVSTDS